MFLDLWERKHYIQGLWYQTSLHIPYPCHTKWCSLGILKKTKCRFSCFRGTAWLARRLVVFTAEAKLRAKTKALRGSQSHLSRALSATKDSWSRTSLGDTLDTLPTSDTDMTGSSKNINLCQTKVFLPNTSSYTQAFLNYLNQKKWIKEINPKKLSSSWLSFFLHTNPSSNHPPPKKKFPVLSLQ